MSFTRRYPITEHEISEQWHRVSKLVKELTGAEPLVLYGGDREHMISNKLAFHGQNLWIDNIAGYTKRDRYNALRIMSSTLAFVFDAQVDKMNKEIVAKLNTEKMYLVCNGCGEAFDDIQAAHQHGASDPQSKTWCGDDGFVILPESEAM